MSKQNDDITKRYDPTHTREQRIKFEEFNGGQPLAKSDTEQTDPTESREKRQAREERGSAMPRAKSGVAGATDDRQTRQLITQVSRLTTRVDDLEKRLNALEPDTTTADFDVNVDEPPKED